jgi:hypothetical protein
MFIFGGQATAKGRKKKHKKENTFKHQLNEIQAMRNIESVYKKLLEPSADLIRRHRHD